MPLFSEHRDQEPRQFVLGKIVGFEDCPHRSDGHVFQIAGKPVSAVVEQRIQRATCARQRFLDRGRHPRLVLVIQNKALQALAFQARTILRTATGRKHPPALLCQPMGCIIAYARGASGDQDGFPIVFHVAFPVGRKKGAP